jgi:hypothetical protein
MRVSGNGSFVAMLAVLGSCVALADPPSSSSPAPETPAAPSAATHATSTSPANPTASPASSAAANAASDDAEAKRLMAQGYKPEMHGGTKVWCKRDAELGSRLSPRKTCGTPEELKMTVHENQEVVERIQRVGSQPTGK